MSNFRVIAVSFFFVVIALAVSLYWNIKQARDSSARGQELYKIGLRDGEIYALNQILRAELEREIIEERQAELERENLKL
jgi:hypothetical protein